MNELQLNLIFSIFSFSSWIKRYYFYVKNGFRNFHQIFTFFFSNITIILFYSIVRIESFIFQNSIIHFYGFFPKMTDCIDKNLSASRAHSHRAQLALLENLSAPRACDSIVALCTPLCLDFALRTWSYILCIRLFLII